MRKVFKSWWIRGICIYLVALLVSTAIGFLGLRISVGTEEGFVSISIGQVELVTTLPYGEAIKHPPTLDIRFNPSGTHVEDGYLKIRLDFYPTRKSKSYALQYIQVPVFSNPLNPFEGYKGKVDGKTGEPISWDDYGIWVSSLPTKWQLNPCLCHFVIIPESTTVNQLFTYIITNFYADVTETIDSVLAQPNAAHLLSAYMRGKSALTMEKIKTSDIAGLISAINQRFSTLPTLNLGTAGTPEPVEGGSISVGAAAINRNTYENLSYTSGNFMTWLDGTVPSDGTGTIDTVNAWWNESIGTDNVRIGTFTLVSGTTYICNDAEAIGDVVGGSAQQYTGLTIAITLNDLIGADCTTLTSTRIEVTSGGSAGDSFYKAGQYCDPGDQVAYTSYTETISLNGTGTEAGGVPDISVSPISYDFGAVAEGSTTNTTTNYFAITNSSTISTDQTVSVTTTIWSGGLGWDNSEAGTPGDNTSAIYAYSSNQTQWIVVKNASPNYIYENCPASTNYTFGLSLQAPTVFYDGVEKTITVRITAVAG